MPVKDTAQIVPFTTIHSSVMLLQQTRCHMREWFLKPGFIMTNNYDQESTELNFFTDGKIAENIRIAILEPTSLDVATGKICDVIERHIFNAKCSTKPSRPAIQKIVDDGQYIAKTFINKEIQEANSMGIAKDGTTRRKVKTQETNVLLSNGKYYSLGFSSLPSETGEAIKNDVETKLDELASVAGDSKFKTTVDFLISDRAANEKKSNKIIKEWSSLILATSQPDHQVQSEYFCMAHVLLAFHTYSLKELKTHGDVLGLDFSAYKNPLEKFLKYASDIFSPVGDYRGVRPVVKNLHQTLKTWKEEPASMFPPSKLCLPQLPTPSVHFETPPNKEDGQMFYSFVSTIAQGFLNAFEAQVRDFLADNADAEHVSTCDKPCLRTRAWNAGRQPKKAPKCLPPPPHDSCSSKTDKDRRAISLAATSFSTSSRPSVEKSQEGGPRAAKKTQGKGLGYSTRMPQTFTDPTLSIS
ncbi:hypothetical protein ElyMa_000556800 [Elysia marginata]|uniref:Uncharacterized protein n=1 Tax=Elysia marginata TaxID=1093978 RepID=A0AAV4G1H7_9GAST|nr:hypothetical protein ElyMa_000556800 [Elysia marginata]